MYCLLYVMVLLYSLDYTVSWLCFILQNIFAGFEFDFENNKTKTGCALKLTLKLSHVYKIKSYFT